MEIKLYYITLIWFIYFAKMVLSHWSCGLWHKQSFPFVWICLYLFCFGFGSNVFGLYVDFFSSHWCQETATLCPIPLLWIRFLKRRRKCPTSLINFFQQLTNNGTSFSEIFFESNKFEQVITHIAWPSFTAAAGQLNYSLVSVHLYCKTWRRWVNLFWPMAAQH